MHTKLKKGLLAFFLVVLLMPFTEQWLNFIHGAPVFGVFAYAPDVEFSFENWWNGTYQDGKTKYLNDFTGFRPDMLRLNNQVDYTLFNKLHFQYGIMGRAGTVWDQLYIDAYLGRDYIGHDTILSKLTKLKKVQDTLAAMGKTFVLVHPPSKAFFMPENLPENQAKLPRGATNFDVINKVADSLGINQINFGAWLTDQKRVSKEVLYSKQGIHWTLYGATLAVDSFVRYIEIKRNISMPHITIAKIDHDKFPRETDADIGQQLNLAIPVEGEIYSYPDLVYPDENRKSKPKAIYIGDSFTFQWNILGVLNHINADWQIWYYFNTVCNNNYYYGHQYAPRVKEINWIAELEKADYIVLMNTTKNLPTFGDRFIEMAYEHYYGKGGVK